jgi:4-hydroxy-tetrahydrodipicolinate synthase
VGAVGIIGVATHWAGTELNDMIVAVEKGDLVAAREINARLQSSFAYSNSDTCVFSQSVKVMMGVLGLDIGECRLPVGPAPDGTQDRARAVLEDLRG